MTGRQASAGTLRSCTPAPARLSSHQSLPTGTVPTRCHVCSSCAPSHPVLLLHDAVTSPCEKNGPLLPVKNRGIHYAAFTVLSCKVTSLGSEYRAKSGKYSPPNASLPYVSVTQSAFRTLRNITSLSPISSGISPPQKHPPLNPSGWCWSGNRERRRCSYRDARPAPGEYRHAACSAPDVVNRTTASATLKSGGSV